MRKQGRESRASLLEFSARTVQNSEKGRDSQASLLEFSTQMAGNSENGRDFRGCFLRISTQTTQIGKIGRDSRGCLLEFSTQMAGNSENGRDSQAQLIENQSSPNLCVNSSSSYVSSSMLPLSSGDLIEWSLVCHSTLSYQKFCD